MTNAASVQPPAIHAAGPPHDRVEDDDGDAGKGESEQNQSRDGAGMRAETMASSRCRRNSTRCMPTGATSSTVAPSEHATVMR